MGFKFRLVGTIGPVLVLLTGLSVGAEKSVLTHGNYCGPGYTGGQKADKNDNQCKADWKPPVDQTDAACQKHDYAYARAGVTASTPQSNPAKQKADRQLVKDLQAAKPAAKTEERYNKAALAVFETKMLVQGLTEQTAAKKKDKRK